MVILFKAALGFSYFDAFKYLIRNKIRKLLRPFIPLKSGVSPLSISVSISLINATISKFLISQGIGGT
jgi:hypothetical protein